MGGQFPGIGLVKGGAGEHGKVHGGDVVAEAGLDEFLRLDRTAGARLRLDNRDLPALGGQMHGSGQPIVTRAQNDRIEFRHLVPPNFRFYFCMHTFSGKCIKLKIVF